MKKIISLLIVASVVFNSILPVLAEDDLANKDEVLLQNAIIDETGELIAEDYTMPKFRYISKDSANNGTNSISSYSNITNYPSQYISEHTQPKFQGAYNGNYSNLCWAYASVSNFETSILKKLNQETDISEEHAVQSINFDDFEEFNYSDDDKVESQKYRYVRDRNSTGSFDDLWNYLTRDGLNGVVNEDDMSYEALHKIKVSMNTLNSYNKLNYYPKSYVAIPDPIKTEGTPSYSAERVNQIKDLIYNNGGVVARIDNVFGYYNSYKEDNDVNYYYNYNSDFEKFKYPHLVEIVGWDDTISVSKFGNPAATVDGAFIAKDSITVKPLYMSYASVNNYNALYSIADVGNRSFFDNQYEHYKLPYINKNSDSKNVFMVDKYQRQSNSYEALVSVNVVLEDPDTKFSVYVSPTGNFEDFQKVDIKNCSSDGEMYYKNMQGEYIVDIADPVLLKSDSYLVGIYLKNNIRNIIYPAEEKFSHSGNQAYTAFPEVNTGESFVLKDFSYFNEDLIKIVGNYYDVGDKFKYNTCIRAYTKNVSKSIIDVDKNQINLPDLYNVYSFNNKEYTQYNQIKKVGDFVYYGSDDHKITINNSFREKDNYGSIVSALKLENKLGNNFLGGIGMILDGKAEIFVTAKSPQGCTLVLKDSNGEDKTSVSFSANKLETKKLECTIINSEIALGLANDGEINITKIQINPLRENNDNSQIDVTYNFSDDYFYNCIGKTYYRAEQGDFEAYLRSTETVSIFSETPAYNGEHYRSSLRLRYTPTYDYANFYVPHNSDIFITLQSDKHIPQTLYVDSVWGENIATLNAEDDIKTYKFKYTGKGEKLCLNVVDSAVKIYSISVRTANENNDYIYKSWNFDSPEYANIEEITENTTISDLGIYAKPYYNVLFKNSNKTVDNMQRRRYISLCGEGTEQRRTLSVNVPQNSTIRILAKSSSKTATRNMVVIDGHNYLLGSYNVTPDLSYYSVNYVGSGDDIYIRSLEGSIDIYGIEIINGNLTIDKFTENAVEPQADISFEGVSDEAISDSAISFDEVVVEDNDISDDIDLSEENLTVLDSDISISDIFDFDRILSYSNNSNLSLYSNDTDVFMYKDQLSEDEKYFYDLLYSTYCQNHSTNDIIYISKSVDINSNETNISAARDEMKAAMTAFINDYPEVFWIQSSYDSIIKKLTYSGDTKIVEYGMIIKRNSNVGSSTAIDGYITSTQQAIDNIVASIPSDIRFNSDYLKAEYLYNYLKNNTIYYTGNSKYNAYCVLVNKNGNCSGISKAFKLLCNEIGIENILIRCNISGYSNDHLCNLIKLDGAWYLCDITADISNDDNFLFMVGLPSNYSLKSITPYSDAKEFDYPDISSQNYFIWGDANLNGELDMDDKDVVMAITLRQSVATPHQLINSDVDYNGSINSRDAAMILQAVLINNSSVDSLNIDSQYFDIANEAYNLLSNASNQEEL